MELACLRKGNTFSSFRMEPMAALGTSGNHHRGLKRSYTYSGNTPCLSSCALPLRLSYLANAISQYVQQILQLLYNLTSPVSVQKDGTHE